jgi:hypothetical protein
MILAGIWARGPVGRGQRHSRAAAIFEDYAIAKLQMLRGIFEPRLPGHRKDLVRRADHAVLVVRAAGKMLVLDNGTTWSPMPTMCMTAILTFAANGAWTTATGGAPDYNHG